MTISSTGSPPQVSVIVLTYNHERFIADAIRSVLGQRDAPPLEVLIAEDCSTDGTQSIVDGFVAESPHVLRRLPRAKNLGLSANLEDAFLQCRGRYIAILEGDDIWCDPCKLQKVVAVLDAHPEWTGCFHAIRQVNELSRPVIEILPSPFPQRPVDFQDLLTENWIPTYSSVTYRRGIVTAFPAWHRDFACGDWGLHLLHAERGPFGFLPEVMTAYRVHSSGMWSGMGEVKRLQQRLSLWAVFDAHYRGRYSAEISAARDKYLREFEQAFADLRKIEQRYHLLQLDHIAAGWQWLRGAAMSILGRRRS